MGWSHIGVEKSTTGYGPIDDLGWMKMMMMMMLNLFLQVR
jgi:hypothetical protein